MWEEYLNNQRLKSSERNLEGEYVFKKDILFKKTKLIVRERKSQSSKSQSPKES